MNYTIKMFLKFGSLENITDLYKEGTIYMNTVEYFRCLEKDKQRGDGYEGASEVINSLPGTFKIKESDQEFKYEKVHIKSQYETILGNLYCLYCISDHGFPNLLDFKMDKRNMDFGSHCLVIKDNAYFFKRIQEELKNQNWEYKHGFVEYYNKNEVSKKLTIFDKPDEFEYQKEFRFYVKNNKLNPIKIQIGSLEKYSEILKIEDIMKIETKLLSKQ